MSWIKIVCSWCCRSYKVEIGIRVGSCCYGFIIVFIVIIFVKKFKKFFFFLFNDDVRVEISK